MKKIAIIGGGGHAKVVASVILKLSDYELIGYIDQIEKESFLNLPYLGNDDFFIEKYKGKIDYVALGIGQTSSVEEKQNLIDVFVKTGFKFPTLISPRATINEEVVVGKGTIILDQVVINPTVSIGDFVTVYPNCVIEHDTIIGDFVYLAPSVNMCGGVIIGTGSSILNGVSISDEMKIEPFSKIKTGTIITK